MGKKYRCWLSWDLNVSLLLPQTNCMILGKSFYLAGPPFFPCVKLEGCTWYFQISMIFDLRLRYGLIRWLEVGRVIRNVHELVFSMSHYHSSHSSAYKPIAQLLACSHSLFPTRLESLWIVTVLVFWFENARTHSFHNLCPTSTVLALAAFSWVLLYSNALPSFEHPLFVDYLI